MKKTKGKYILKKKRRNNTLKSVSLANFPKKLFGIKNKYVYKCNIHHCIFTNAIFEHNRYRAGHITDSNFRDAKFSNVDFVFINLKNNIFKSAKFKNCTFYGCNLSGSNFENALFENCFFINCKLKKCINFTETNICSDNKQKLVIPDELVKLVLSLNKTEKYNILKTKEGSINKILVKLFLDIYPLDKLLRVLKVIGDWKSEFITYFDYKNALQIYLKQ